MQQMRVVKNSPQYLANYILLMIGCLSRSEVMTRLIKWNLALASCQSGQAKFIYNLSSPCLQSPLSFGSAHYLFGPKKITSFIADVITTRNKLITMPPG